MTSSHDPVVETAAGAVRGRRTGGVTRFGGIPYGAAPVGERRFAAPAPPPGWRGVRDAFEPGPAAPQSASRLDRIVGPMRLPRQSEDCLSVNVWTPDLRGRLPVLVWLHGGAYITGSGGQDWYSGAQLAAHGDLVVVTVTYRLGPLGFLYPAGPAEDMGGGNAGLLDQIAALRWVRENIANFGGDPGQVTLAGQSVGALSALAMMSTPHADGLFRRVVMQSTPTGITPMTAAEATSVTERYLRALELRPSQAHRLRTLPVDRLLAAQGELLRTSPPLRIAPPFQLVADDDLVVADLLSASGWADGMDRLIGSTRDEAAAWTASDERLHDLDRSAAVEVARGFLGEAAEDEYRRASEEAAHPTPPEVLKLLATDYFFERDIPRLAVRSGGRSHVYRFDWSPAGSPLGACHCVELPFVFGTLGAWREAPMLAGAGRPEQASLSVAVKHAWAAFAHTGDPDHHGIPGWPEYRARGAVMHFGKDPHVRTTGR
ncbi:carboxylesterase/lipase family protein [Streptosporangium canum]|uniref:carboxylesterase/lipase family protein n=1 Tax=Streptosporangium canum TaxID=324952 RepID=UPI0036C39A79